MSAVIVDWLGRGGIAHCTAAWALELERAGCSVTVVTRPGREISRTAVEVVTADHRRNRVAAHHAVAVRAAGVIESRRPSIVIVQNYVIPPLENAVYRAARRAHARIVLVVHDHRLHSRLAGSSLGLRRLLHGADDVVAHSNWVADACRAMGRRTVGVVPLPVQLGLLNAPDQVLPFARDPHALLALHFGILRRGYKGTDLVVGLARSSVPGWRVAALGVGAPEADGLLSVNRFLAPGELVASVRNSAVTLLPYRFATQSGAVVLAQALRSVPIVTRVGGVPEQVEDGCTGRVLAADAPVAAWREVLEGLTDAAHRTAIAERAHDKVWDDHSRFRAAVTELAGGR